MPDTCSAPYRGADLMWFRLRAAAINRIIDPEPFGRFLDGKDWTEGWPMPVLHVLRYPEHTQEVAADA